MVAHLSAGPASRWALEEPWCTEKPQMAAMGSAAGSAEKQRFSPRGESSPGNNTKGLCQIVQGYR